MAYGGIQQMRNALGGMEGSGLSVAERYGEGGRG